VVCHVAVDCMCGCCCVAEKYILLVFCGWGYVVVAGIYILLVSGGCGSVACIYSVGGLWLGFCGSGRNLYIVCVWCWGSVACMVVAGLLNCSFLVRGVIIWSLNFLQIWLTSVVTVAVVRAVFVLLLVRKIPVISISIIAVVSSCIEFLG
jgi:hypothetical protein